MKQQGEAPLNSEVKMPVSNDISNKTAAHKLNVRKVFDNLARDDTEKGSSYTLYAHHLARACWHGSRIILRQTSPEAEGIFDFILELHRACHGQWSNFRSCGIEQDELEAWLDFAVMFLSSLGNYFVSSTESSSGMFRGIIQSC